MYPGKPRRSNWWYLLPMFLNIIGGVIAYFAVRKDDPELAKNCIIVGLIFFAFYFYWLFDWVYSYLDFN